MPSLFTSEHIARIRANLEDLPNQGKWRESGVLYGGDHAVITDEEVQQLIARVGHRETLQLVVQAAPLIHELLDEIERRGGLLDDEAPDWDKD